MSQHNLSDPWWNAPPPWTCRRCSRRFGYSPDEWAHLEGHYFCGDWSCSCLCSHCWAVLQLEGAMAHLGAEVEPSEPGVELVAVPGFPLVSYDGLHLYENP